MPDSNLRHLLRDRALADDLLAMLARGDAPDGAKTLGVDPDHIRRRLEQNALRPESVDGADAGDGQDQALEAIVRLHARPSLEVRAGRIQVTPRGVWHHRLAPRQDALATPLAAVGRIDLCGHDAFDWVGTAWMVADGIAITNRHVVEAFAYAQDGTWRLGQRDVPARGDGLRADVDFFDASGKIHVRAIRWVWHGPGPSADLALLEVEGDQLPQPIPLATRNVEVDDFVAAVGFPARDSRNEDDAMARIFHGSYGIKRFAPGQVTADDDDIRFEHDCSTLGGNSGSVVIDIARGDAVGLHFGGTFRRANFAVHASVVRDALQRAGIGSTRSAAATTGLGAAITAARQVAARACDDAVQRIAQRREPLPLAEARELLQALRDSGEHQRLVDVGTGVVAGGQQHPTILRLLAQGGIECGDLELAVEHLERAASALQERLPSAGDPRQSATSLWIRAELAEVQGLLGRAYKQRYLEARPTAAAPHGELLERATGSYEQAYRSSPVTHLWQGINVVALRDHDRRVAGGSGLDDATTALAHDVLANVDVLVELGDASPWDLATRAEALLALGQFDACTAAVDTWLAHDQLTPFMVRSFERQMRDLWHLHEGTAPGNRILQAVRQWRRAPPPTAAARPAKAELRTEVADNRAAQRARGIAKVGRSFFDGQGSAFLIDPTGIWPDYDGPRNVFLLTNAHVCSPNADPLGDGPLHPRLARFAFLGPKGKVDRQVLVAYAETLWSSPPTELDATLLLLDGGPNLTPAPVASALPDLGRPVSVVGYPLGGGLWYSAQDNVLQQIDDRYLGYTTRTEPGMSGSPVFDADWNLLAMHRHGDLERHRNGGVRIDRIVAAIRHDLHAAFGTRGRDAMLPNDAAP